MIRQAPVHVLGASAITVWPCILISPLVTPDEYPSIIAHEAVHYRQQQRWALYGLGVGLLVWFALYLLVLPVGWNPWRERWEREAYATEGYGRDYVTGLLRKSPYLLWWCG